MSKLGEVVYGESKYGDSKLDPEDIDFKSPELIYYLPIYYHEMLEAVEIQESISREIGLADYRKNDVLDQLFIDTATWGLSIWEDRLGINVNPSAPPDQRRSVIKAKLRGKGTTTKVMIKEVASAYSRGEVEVEEVFDEFKFIVRFTGTRGIPPNMGDLTRSINDIKPAHLVFDYVYTYLVWEEAVKYTWEEAAQFTWDEFRELE